MHDEAPEIGSVWESKDKRDNGKRVTVVAVNDSFVWIKGVMKTRVRRPLTRLYRPVP